MVRGASRQFSAAHEFQYQLGRSGSQAAQRAIATPSYSAPRLRSIARRSVRMLG